MERDVIMREVGLRDGIQGYHQFMPTESKLQWVRAEAQAGMPEIEVTSYVPPKLLPQFADAETVTRESLNVPGLTVAALIPNLKGAQRGFELGVHKLNFVMSVSETHNQKNVRRSRETSLDEFRSIVEQAKALPAERRPIICGGLATALGCSYEGAIEVSEVQRWVAYLLEAGAEELIIPDTVGYAAPALVKQVFKAVLAEAGSIPVAAHFHDTRGTGLANLCAALEVGVRHFDASLAGIGGCPFAPGASGNIVMEDAVYMLESMGVRTGIDIERLVAVREILSAGLPELGLEGAIARAGLPRGFSPATLAA